MTMAEVDLVKAIPDGTLCFLSVKDVTQKTSLSRASLYRMMDQGLFPTTINLGGRRVVFIEREVEEWMLERIAQRLV